VLQGAVAEELKSDEQTRNVPILLMTGYTKNMQNTLYHFLGKFSTDDKPAITKIYMR
jgi:CheY-like chemotaxis protein